VKWVQFYGLFRWTRFLLIWLVKTATECLSQFHVEKAWISTWPVTARVGERLWKALDVEDSLHLTCLSFILNLIFVSLFVREILAHFFCPSPHLESSFLRKWRICVRISTILPLLHDATKSAKICPIVILVDCCEEVCFSYLGQNLKNDQQWPFCLFCAISQKFVLRLNTSSMWWVTVFFSACTCTRGK
jgi:hypothetical protein